MPNSLLPQILQDESNLALENCLNESFNFDFAKIMTCIPNTLSDSVLAELAKQFHVTSEGWNDCKTREEKINLIKNAIPLHRIKGTVKAIKDCLNIENVDTKYLSWYEYNGIPHHFKLKFSFDGISVTEEIINIIRKKIEEFKQLRAKLDITELQNVIKTDVFVTPITLISKKIIV